MGYVFNHQDAMAYDLWFRNRRNRFSATLETRMLFELLRPAPGESLLDIGCGTGELLLQGLDAGLDVTGIDPSPHMLDIAFRKTGESVDLFRGYGEDLPFDDNSFHHACFFTTLEFVDQPEKALEEAFRVAKDRVFIGVLNRYAIKGLKRRIQGLFGHSLYANARFYSIWELKQMVRQLLGDVPVSWRSVCLFPEPSSPFACSLEQWPLAQRMPFGTFVGMVVTLKPRFRLRPLALRYRAGTPARASLTGLAAQTGNFATVSPAFSATHSWQDKKLKDA